MSRLCAEDARRVPLWRFARRAVVLAAVCAGLWLAGQATASAQERTPSLTAVGALSSTVGDAAIPGDELQLARAASAVASAGGQTAVVMAPAAKLTSAVVAPVAPVWVAPVVSAAAPVVRSVAAPVAELPEPVADLAVPVVRAAKPVLQAAAPLRDVAAPVVAAAGKALVLVAQAGLPLTGVLGPVLGPAVDALTLVLSADPIRGQELPDADVHRQNAAVRGLTAGTAGTGAAIVPADDDVITVDGAAGAPVPVRPPAPATGGPAPASCTGAHFFDQSPADLSADGRAMTTAALAVTGDARDAAGNVASDPSFSPD